MIKENLTKNTEIKPVSKHMLISKIVYEYPEVTPLLMEYGFHCIGCHASTQETLEEGALGHGFDEEMINMILKDVNTIVSIEREEKKNTSKKINKKKSN